MKRSLKKKEKGKGVDDLGAGAQPAKKPPKGLFEIAFTLVVAAGVGAYGGVSLFASWKAAVLGALASVTVAVVVLARGQEYF